MASSGTINGSFSGVATTVAYPYIYWEVVATGPNYHNVKASIYYKKLNASWGSYNLSHSVTETINGDSNTGNFAFDLRPVGTAPITCFVRSRTVTVYHNAPVNITISFSSVTGTSLKNGSASGTASLDAIPVVPSVSTDAC